MKKFFAAALIAGALALVPASSVAADLDAGGFAGFWLATSASHFPDPHPWMDQFYMLPDGHIYVYVVNHEGKIGDWNYKPQVGEFVSITNRPGVQVMVTKVSDRRVEHTWKNADGTTYKTWAELSADGQTQTFHAPSETVIFKKYQQW